MISILLAAAISQDIGPFGPTSTSQSAGEPLREGREGEQEPEAGSLSSKNCRGDSPIWKSRRGMDAQPLWRTPIPPQGSPARAGPCPQNLPSGRTRRQRGQ